MRTMKNYEVKVLEWLGLDADFRDQKDTQYSYVNYLLGIAYPDMTVEEIKGLNSTPVKLKLLFKSLYLAEEPLSFEDVFQIFNRRELGFIILDLQDAFCDDIHQFSQYLGFPATHSGVFKQIEFTVLDSGYQSLDQLLDVVGLDVLLQKKESEGYNDFDPMILINRRDTRGRGLVWRQGRYIADVYCEVEEVYQWTKIEF